MRMRNSGVRGGLSRGRGNLPDKAMKFSTAAMLVAIGFTLVLPFIYQVFIAHSYVHYMTFWSVLTIIGVIVGGPMLMSGIICLFTLNNGVRNGSLVENDIARIRYAAEIEMLRNKK